jgi:hypothetical protein
VARHQEIHFRKELRLTARWVSDMRIHSSISVLDAEYCWLSVLRKLHASAAWNTEADLVQRL